ncbi:hypothetical protein [Roseateles sp.]|uniref:hypothetical protein n=1 Tax=Roseateles sp. TaxID=1971397 RepID=UPI00286A2150|nr:hypothetical protein [Roseateles sp.]
MKCEISQKFHRKQRFAAIPTSASYASSGLLESSRLMSSLKQYLQCLAVALAWVPVLSAAQTPMPQPPQKQVAAAPSFAGPSMVEATKAAVFTGKGFKPNAPVSIALRTPAGVETHLSAVVAADGSLNHRVQPQGPGPYSLTVLDSGGKTLSSTNFHVMQ